MNLNDGARFRIVLLTILVMLQASGVWDGTVRAAEAAKRAPLPVFKVKGRMVIKSYDFKSRQLIEGDVIDATLATDGEKWRMIVDSERNSHSDSFFDGTDTYFYRPVGAFLPGHKAPGDERISYTLSIYPVNKAPVFFGAERLLWVVFFSGKQLREQGELPPVWNLSGASATTNFTSAGDKLNCVLKADFGSDANADGTEEAEPRSELRVSKIAEIGGVKIPKSFRWRGWGAVPSDSGSKVELTGEWTFEAKDISFGDQRDLDYPSAQGIGSIQDMRVHEARRNQVVWNNSENRKVAYEWNDKQLPTRGVTNLIERIPPLIYRGILVERNGRLVKVDENDPSLRPRR